jgi:hypothetical protein
MIAVEEDTTLQAIMAEDVFDPLGHSSGPDVSWWRHRTAFSSMSQVPPIRLFAGGKYWAALMDF